MQPFFHDLVEPHLQAAMLNPDLPAKELSVLAWVDLQIQDQNPVLSQTILKPLNRYNILPGKTFASSAKSKDKFKVLRLVADDVVYQNLKNQEVKTVQIDKLLKEWSQKSFKEVTFVDEIVETVKSILGPALGTFLTAALVNWLLEQITF